MQIRRYTPDDADALAAAVALVNAVREHDAPFAHPVTVQGHGGWIRHGWDGEPPEAYAAVEGGRVVGLVEVHVSEWDNTHLAWLGGQVHPVFRGAGRGTALLAFAEARARELGRTSIGIDGWDIESTRRFAGSHDLPVRSTAVNRRQTLAKVDWDLLGRMYDEATAAASDYELLHIAGPTPVTLLDAVAEMTAAINDAPTDDLDIEDEVFPKERIAGYERAQAARGRRLYRVVARHKGTGVLAGHTVVAVEGERPWIGDQHDTSVVRAHRGHRLGLLLKADMLRWLADVEPGLETVDTWNAESNDHMIAVNEALGYEMLARELEMQRDART
jgi:GNAT superfamily N-acetyltransferase